MARVSLHVDGFGGGVALLGSADARKVDEVLEADGVDLGPRGALVAASDATDYVSGVGVLSAMPTAVRALLTTSGINYVEALAVVEAPDGGGGQAYEVAHFAREGHVGPMAGGLTFTRLAPGLDVGAAFPVLVDGVYVTSAIVQGTQAFKTNDTADPAVAYNVFLVNVGAREGAAPRAAPGLYALVVLPGGAPVFFLLPIGKFDALGTGPFGLLNTATAPQYGTKSQQLHFRGITSFNGYVFGWGFDAADAAHGDGPCRVMFSNLGRPLVWGNDNVFEAPATAPTGDRLFTDSDALVFGTAGEIIRAALVVFGKLFFATNRALHFIQGYGRATFITNGATPVMNAYNVVGPHALIEGPDRLLYGVGDQGLWRFDGVGVPVPLFEQLVDFTGRSPGWWDLIWTDPGRGPGTPGRTNADLVWTAVDWARQQVLVGIPWCDAASGAGYGPDTVVIRYHTRTGGFTRQVFAGVQYSAAGYFRRENQQPEVRLLGTATPGHATVQRYAYTPNAAATPMLPRTLPRVTIGPYAPFGPDGDGVVQRAYATLAWAAGALPLAFDVTVTVDGAVTDAFALLIGPDAPSAPSAGDCWLDTSGTNPSLGNARAGVSVAARGGYVLATYVGGRWQLVPGLGAQGTRATIPLSLTRCTGARVTLTLACTAAAGRFELEGVGINPGAGAPDA